MLTAALCTSAALIVGIHWGNFLGAGPDSSGYVSEADLWAHGKLTIPAPVWANDARWTHAVWSSGPVGYRPTQRPLDFAPVYSPGYPLMMAAFQKVGGRNAVFYVLPLLGALVVWASYLLGRYLGNAWSGAIAALLMVCSPTFLWYLVRPMSDVPVTACWGMALVFALSGGSRGAVLSGIAAGAAILVRPNVAPLAAIPMLLLAMTGESKIRRLFLFGVAAAPSALVIAGLNWYWYGSPLTSGYGTLDALYSTKFIWPNLQRYPACTGFQIPSLDCFVPRAGRRPCPIRADSHAPDPALVPRKLAFQHGQRLGLLQRLRGLLHGFDLRRGRAQSRLGPAGGQQFFECRLSLPAVIHIFVAPQHVREITVGQQQWDEAPAGIGRIAEQNGAAFERHPFRPQRRRRQTQHLGSRRLESAFDGQVDVIAWLDDPVVEPHPQPCGAQLFRQPAHPWLVLRVVAQENVVGEAIGHTDEDAMSEVSTSRGMHANTAGGVVSYEGEKMRAAHI
jgi:hypothetical protein